jgi:hypothetical protein
MEDNQPTPDGIKGAAALNKGIKLLTAIADADVPPSARDLSDQTMLRGRRCTVCSRRYQPDWCGNPPAVIPINSAPRWSRSRTARWTRWIFATSPTNIS